MFDPFACWFVDLSNTGMVNSSGPDSRPSPGCGHLPTRRGYHSQAVWFGGSKLEEGGSVEAACTYSKVGRSISLSQQPWTPMSGAEMADVEVVPAGGIGGFAADTRILTERGEMAIQDLRVGDLVIACCGPTMSPLTAMSRAIGQSHRRIEWIGEQRLVPALHDKPETVFPIRICAGAFATGAPRRDLLVSPRQAIIVDGDAIPAAELINGATILREETARSVRYFHVELDGHGILSAEGLACESFAGPDMHGFFADAWPGVADRHHAGVGTHQDRRRATVRVRRPDVARIRRLLLDRIMALGMVVSADADVRLVADGIMLRPSWTVGGCYGFWLKQPSTNIRLVSSSGVRGDTDAAPNGDRRLGIAVKRIAHCPFDRTAPPVILPLDGWTRDTGWHDIERDAASDVHWRWTDGAAQLPDLDSGELIIETVRQR